jgi:CelD/BcsL family acetyltransferase involved in cellulose biosynthesis
MIRIEQITTEAEIDRLTPEWKVLWRRVDNATPFQSPEWLLSWWQFFGTGAPLIIAAHSDGELVGILPLYVLDEGGCRKLLPIGISLSDYLDALVDRDISGTVEAMLATIAEIRGWDECHLPSLSPDAALLAASPPSGLVESRYADEQCTFLALPSTVEGLNGVLSQKRRQNLRRARRRMALIGEPKFEIADDTRIFEAMKNLFRLHVMRWGRRGQLGVCADPLVQNFHMTAARRLLEAGMLRLYSLRLDGTTLAVCYCFTANSIAYAYLSGFDPDHAQLSPGTQLLDYAIRSAVREGGREFHFLRGEEAYKSAWRPIARSSVMRTLRRQG